MGTGYQSAGLKRRQLARKVRWYIITFSFLSVTLGVLYVLGFSGLFTVTTFNVVGAPAGQEARIIEVLKPQVVGGRIGGILGADNYFAWTNSLRYEDIRSNRVSIGKEFWARRITINVHPRERYGVWCIVSPENIPNCNWVDGSGVVFEPAPTPDGQLVIALFELASTTEAVLGTPIIKANYFTVIKQVAEGAVQLHIPLSQIVVDRALEEVRLETLSDVRISFSLRFDPITAALPALEKLIGSPGISGMRTIDFTVENRVFYTAK